MRSSFEVGIQPDLGYVQLNLKDNPIQPNKTSAANAEPHLIDFEAPPFSSLTLPPIFIPAPPNCPMLLPEPSTTPTKSPSSQTTVL